MRVRMVFNRGMPPLFPEPHSENSHLRAHADLLQASFRHWTGRELLSEEELQGDSAERARRLYEAPFVVLSHNAEADPVFTYGNLTAQRLFELSWGELTGMPSRFSAELPNREERARLLDTVARCGFMEDYEGVRISKTGRRFLVRRALVWNLVDGSGNRCGQAATFREWEPVEVSSDLKR
ncbi:MAG: hypothetical protein RLZZ244_393 [Verrucomicrobiota bacterium]|jgi:hypothetical protein